MYNAIVLFQNNPHNETNMVATVCMVTHTHVHTCIVPGLLIIKYIHLTQHWKCAVYLKQLHGYVIL